MLNNDPTVCHLYFIRRARGTLTKYSSLKATFDSHEGSLEQLELTHLERRCGELVWRTRYPGIFLSTSRTNLAFNRPLPRDERSELVPLDQVYQRQWERAMASISRGAHHLALQECEQATSQGTKIQSNEPFSLGNGYFIIRQGEVWQRYQCLSTHVVVSSSCRYSTMCICTRPACHMCVYKTRPITDPSQLSLTCCLC
jgi:hypothetical protein